MKQQAPRYPDVCSIGQSVERLDPAVLIMVDQYSFLGVVLKTFILQGWITLQFIFKTGLESWNMSISTHTAHHTFNPPYVLCFNIYQKVVLIIPMVALLCRKYCRDHQKCVNGSLPESNGDTRHRGWLIRDVSIWAFIENVNEHGLRMSPLRNYTSLYVSFIHLL